MLVSAAVGAHQPVPVPLKATQEIPVQTVEEKRTETELKNSIDIEAYVKEYFKDTPILAEIARCESSFRQSNKNGDVIRGLKNPADVGVMQINEKYHLERAKSLKIDLHTLEGNLEYARKLYTLEGAYPWMASSPCWSKVSELALGKSKNSTN